MQKNKFKEWEIWNMTVDNFVDESGINKFPTEQKRA